MLSFTLPRSFELRCSHSGSGAGKDRLQRHGPLELCRSGYRRYGGWLRSWPLVMLLPGLGPVSWVRPMEWPLDFMLEYLSHMVVEVFSPRRPWQVRPRPLPPEQDHSAALAMVVALQELRLWLRAQPPPGFAHGPSSGMPSTAQPPQAQSGPSQTGSPTLLRGMNASANPDELSGAAFEALDKAPMTTSSPSAPTDPAVAGDQVAKALTAALTGERRACPNGQARWRTFVSWLRSLAFWSSTTTSQRANGA